MLETSTSCEIEDYKEWVLNLKLTGPRILHPMFRVRNIEESIRFYCDGLGMKIFGHFDVEEKGISVYFLGFNVGMVAIELAYYWKRPSAFMHGSTYSYLAIGFPNIDGVSDRLNRIGAEFVIKPGLILDRWPRVAFVKDPDGYMIELIETQSEVS